MGFERLDDLSTAGQDNRDGVMMLFHEIGHKILADTMVDISQDPGCAGKNKNTSCPVPTSEVSTKSQIVPMTWRRG